jgi:serine/threonine-protein kinase
MTGEVVSGRYRLDERLEAGAMSEVWVAYDLELERPVALKLLGASTDRLRFEREGRAVASLSHPNVCRLYDLGEADGRPFIVLEYLPGGSLEERLRPGEPLPDDQTARVVAELAAALAHAHAHGLVHRDVKPSNILFDDEGHAKLADFGITRILDASTLTEAGTVVGTAAYISPEQARAEPVTTATDVYASGVILYRLLTGRLPFEAEAPLELALKHVNEQPVPISELRPDAPPQLERVATWALAKRPEDRPPDGAALMMALAQGAPPVVDDETRVLARPRRRVGRRHVAVGVALAVLALAGAALAFLINPEPSQAPVERETTRRTTTSTPPASPPPPPATTEATTSEQTTTTAPTTAETETAPATTAPEPPPPAPPPPPITEILPPPPTEPITTTVDTITITTPIP